jgi:hypothetical protein
MIKDSWLYSDSFLKRCFAIWGHFYVAHLIITIPFFILGLIVAAMFFRSVASTSDIQKIIDQQPGYGQFPQP